MVKKIIINDTFFLELQGDSYWKKVYLHEENDILFLGAENYDVIINRFSKFMRKKKADIKTPFLIIAFAETYNSIYFLPMHNEGIMIFQDKNLKCIKSFDSINKDRIEFVC